MKSHHLTELEKRYIGYIYNYWKKYSCAIFLTELRSSDTEPSWLRSAGETGSSYEIYLKANVEISLMHVTTVRNIPYASEMRLKISLGVIETINQPTYCVRPANHQAQKKSRSYHPISFTKQLTVASRLRGIRFALLQIHSDGSARLIRLLKRTPLKNTVELQTREEGMVEEQIRTVTNKTDLQNRPPLKWNKGHLGREIYCKKRKITTGKNGDAGIYECHANNKWSVDMRSFRTDYNIFF
ncbi:unnamed protein product [Lepeophtheirus salmonis]|uniref:(salmon louse) hypothetical protein n=1 Tax=Lepeophtheirus salmonis TaxID=72036 RepID=A0A7R8CH29_LEPSM|nr:unnamed protein product [Lepeophtheirus salmonis]CAF2815837.1 unnamed protein product [Lepeophtheirus salmonis]